MAWQDIQKKTFTRWCNEYLKERGMSITDLFVDLKDGLLLINLLEVISGKSLGRYNRNPRIQPQRLENNVVCLNFLKEEGIKLVNIGPEDLVDGKAKLILGLIWTLILRYHIKMSETTDGGAKNELLKWVQSKIPDYNIKGFTKDWNDGKAVCALVDALQPGLCPDHKSLNAGKALDNATKGIDIAHNQMGIPPVLAPEDMVNPKVDELSMMTYISYFRDWENKPKPKGLDASRCRAHGPGLVEVVVNEQGDFVVETPKGCAGKLEIKVEGPKSTAQVNVTKNGDNYNVSYTPTEPGEWKVSVTLDGVHIPGSIFHVVVLEAVSLGGEGKIRVYYSTTNKSDKARADVANLQKLLEDKSIHKRPDFEPWIPVDLMDKPDREAVFKKAGTRNLPIVFIDDKYTGDYDTCVDLEKSGKLNILLNYNQNKKQR